MELKKQSLEFYVPRYVLRDKANITGVQQISES